MSQVICEYCCSAGQCHLHSHYLCSTDTIYLCLFLLYSSPCRALNIAMYSVMIIIAAVLGIQCLCSLVYLVRMKRTITREDTRSKIIVMVSGCKFIS